MTEFNYVESMDKIKRERLTETWVRSVDTVDVVEKIHDLEDMMEVDLQTIADSGGKIERLESTNRALVEALVRLVKSCGNIKMYDDVDDIDTDIFHSMMLAMEALKTAKEQ